MKLVYDRAEDMLATTKRHPSIVRHRTGVTGKGKLVAMDIDVVLDGGAYVTLSPVVLSRALPPRRRGVPLRQRARSTGARCSPTRRPTAPSAASARRRPSSPSRRTWTASPRRSGWTRRACGCGTCCAPGDTTATGQVMGADCSRRDGAARGGAPLGLDAASATAWRGTDRGIGLALFRHGAGFTGSGEVRARVARARS